MLRTTTARGRHYLILALVVTCCGCWKFRPPRWEEVHAKDNYMRFRIGVQEFESFVPRPVNVFGDGEMIDLDRLPSAHQSTEKQSSIFAVLRDREENVIEIYIYLPSLDPGTYVLADSSYSLSTSLAWYSIQTNGANRRSYRTSPSAPAIITITEHDTSRRILRGIFTMDAELPSQRLTRSWPRRLSITDGVFEIRSLTRLWDDNPFRR